MNLEQTIIQLADTSGVSGDENKAAELALEMLKEFTDDCYIKNGNVTTDVQHGKNGVSHRVNWRVFFGGKGAKNPIRFFSENQPIYYRRKVVTA